MDIFERVREAALKLKRAGSEARLAEAIGLTQQKLNRYIRERSSKLWDHLPAMLSAFPEVSREWLYFGEGEMLVDDGERVAASPLTTSLPPLRAAAWRGQGKEGDDLAALRNENGMLKDKLIAALEDNKALRDELARIAQLGGEGGTLPFTRPAEGGRGAPGALEE